MHFVTYETKTGAKIPIGKAKSSQNAYKHGLGKLQKEMRQLLKEHKKAIQVIS